jgi:hypothetical protein
MSDRNAGPTVFDMNISTFNHSPYIQEQGYILLGKVLFLLFVLICLINTGTGEYTAGKSLGLLDHCPVRSDSRCYPRACAENCPESTPSLQEESISDPDFHVCHSTHRVTGISIVIEIV